MKHFCCIAFGWVLFASAFSCNSKAKVTSVNKRAVPPSDSDEDKDSDSDKSNKKKKSVAKKNNKVVTGLKPAVAFLIEAPSSAVAGTDFTVEIFAVNAQNEQVESYDGETSIWFVRDQSRDVGKLKSMRAWEL